MSVGYITRRVWLWFNSWRPGGLYQPEVRYSTNCDHAGNSGQKRNQRAAAAAGEEV
jgi:hypothetical protein